MSMPCGPLRQACCPQSSWPPQPPLSHIELPSSKQRGCHCQYPLTRPHMTAPARQCRDFALIASRGGNNGGGNAAFATVAATAGVVFCSGVKSSLGTTNRRLNAITGAREKLVTRKTKGNANRWNCERVNTGNAKQLKYEK